MSPPVAARLQDPAPDEALEPELLAFLEAIARAHVEEDWAAAHGGAAGHDR